MHTIEERGKLAPKVKAKPKSTIRAAAPYSQPVVEAKADARTSIFFDDVFTSLENYIKASDYKHIIKVTDDILGISLGKVGNQQRKYKYHLGALPICCSVHKILHRWM